MNTINIHKWEMDILTNAKIAPNLTLKNVERLKNKILHGFCLKENVIEKKQEGIQLKVKNL